MFKNFFTIDYTKELEPISLWWYIKGVIKGLFVCLPLAVIFAIIPIVGWFFLIVLPVIPFIYPFIERENIKKGQRKLRERYGLTDKDHEEFIKREKQKMGERK